MQCCVVLGADLLDTVYAINYKVQSNFKSELSLLS